MIFTRHLVAFSGLLIVGLLAILFFVFGHQGPTVAEEPIVTFVTTDAEYNVVAYTDDAANENKLSFIEKVRNALRQDPPQEIEPEREVIEAPETENEVYENYTRPFVSSQPQKGAVYACSLYSTDVPAPSDTPWIISDAQWSPSEKPVVQGGLGEYGVITISEENQNRVIRAQGIPTHSMGTFPASPDDPSFVSGVNTYPARLQSYVLTVSSTPQIASAPSCIATDVVGVLNSGALLFRGITQGGGDARLTALTDSCGGHVDTLGRYHYHEESDCVQANTDGSLGYALDGFGIFGSVEEGAKVTNADLDVCHGHTHSIIWDGVVTNMYHYHITEEYPYSIGCFMGTPQPLMTR